MSTLRDAPNSRMDNAVVQQIPTRAGEVYGRLLAYLDRPTLATWSQSSGLSLYFARWYTRILGFPELAAHRRFRAIRDMLHKQAGTNILDLGAGNGLYSLADAIRRPGGVHILIDLSERHMRRATITGRALGLPVWGIACSAEALPLASQSMDTILLIELLQFTNDDEAVVKELGRVLRSGGAWLCEQDCSPPGTPLVSVAESRLQKRRAGYTRDALCKLAASAGLVLEEYHPVSAGVGRRWESIDGRIFRKNRTLYFLLFPLIRLLALWTTPAPIQEDLGTVLYLFRKPRTNGGWS